MIDLNIHPIFVHFPVALLTIYSLLELIRFKAALRQTYWFYVKATFVIIGALSTAPTLFTGNMAESIVMRNNPAVWQLIETHSTLAVITTSIFGVLAFTYLIEWVQRNNYFFIKNNFWIAVWRICLWVKNLVMQTWLTMILALAGLISVTITGSLGGAIAYGPDLDPMVHFVYKLFFR